MITTAKAKIAGVIGWPISHSRSPLIHGHWLDRYNIDGAYIPFAVKSEDGVEAIRALSKLGFSGTNVTLPHKLTAFQTVDVRDAAAEAIGAVNTVVVQPDGSLHGSNTDAAGLLAHLRASSPGWNATAAPVMILGAGGSARAAIFALLGAGVREVRLSNRTRDKAETLADAFGHKVKIIDWRERSNALAGCGLLVNTTSLGMTGQPALHIVLEDLPRGAVVYDIVYSPLETPLLATARAQGNQGIDGLGMLLHQATPGFEAWFGIKPVVDETLRNVILSDLT